MSSPDVLWWSVRAGEYVLGTLEDNDQILFERILAHDTSVQIEVVQWEQRLAGLNETASSCEPGEHVWPEILERVRCLNNGVNDNDRKQPAVSSTVESEATGKESVRSGDVNQIRSARKLQLWKGIAGLATAASIVLGVLLLQQRTDPTAIPLKVDGLAVVLSDESGVPFFLVETDYGNLRVRVTALAPSSLDDNRDFQLWQALPDRSAVRPVALLPEEPGVSAIFNVDSLIDGSDLFGVSIEPVGALTDSGPTGPVVAHGDFLPTRESD